MKTVGGAEANILETLCRTLLRKEFYVIVLALTWPSHPLSRSGDWDTREFPPRSKPTVLRVEKWKKNWNQDFRLENGIKILILVRLGQPPSLVNRPPLGTLELQSRAYPHDAVNFVLLDPQPFGKWRFMTLTPQAFNSVLTVNTLWHK